MKKSELRQLIKEEINLTERNLGDDPYDICEEIWNGSNHLLDRMDDLLKHSKTSKASLIKIKKHFWAGRNALDKVRETEGWE